MSKLQDAYMSALDKLSVTTHQKFVERVIRTELESIEIADMSESARRIMIECGMLSVGVGDPFRAEYLLKSAKSEDLDFLLEHFTENELRLIKLERLKRCGMLESWNVVSCGKTTHELVIDILPAPCADQVLIDSLDNSNEHM